MQDSVWSDVKIFGNKTASYLLDAIVNGMYALYHASLFSQRGDWKQNSEQLIDRNMDNDITGCQVSFPIHCIWRIHCGFLGKAKDRYSDTLGIKITVFIWWR